MELGCSREAVLSFLEKDTGESGLVVFSEESGLCVVFLSSELFS